MRRLLPLTIMPALRAVLLLIALLLIYSGLAAQATDSLVFRDDFNRTTLGNHWESPTSWTIQNKSAYLFAGSHRWLRTSTTYALPSYIIETAALGFTPGYRREFRITFGQEDSASHKMYMLLYQPYFGGIFTLARTIDDYYTYETLDESVLHPNLNADKWYKFKIARYKSGLIQVYVDRGKGYGAKPILEAIDDTHKQMGKIGWRSDTETFDELFFVDWISAHKPAVEKSAVKEKPAEDDLVTQVSATSGRNYSVTKLAAGVKAYTDRIYTITSFPPYMKGASYVQTAMDDKRGNAANFFTSFVKKDAVVYIGYDPRAAVVPAWLSTWTKTSDRIELTDPGTPYLDVYSKVVAYGQTYPYPLQLGGNLAVPARGSKMNYVVAAIELPGSVKLEAEQATYKGAAKRSNHPGYSGSGFVDFQNKSGDYIEWTVNIELPGTYNLNFVYANGHTADRPLQIAHNNKPITTLPFSKTFSWSSWAFTSGPAIYLTPGMHQIKATAIGASGPNIDFITLTYLNAGPVGAAPLLFAAGKNKPAALFPEQEPASASPLAYPNPFTGNTHITYEVNKTGRVWLALFDIEGKAVRSLVDEVQQPGRYRVLIDGRNLPTGTYFYRLLSTSGITTAKLVKN